MLSHFLSNGWTLINITHKNNVVDIGSFEDELEPECSYHSKVKFCHSLEFGKSGGETHHKLN